MSIESTHDDGQHLPSPVGKLIGFFDDRSRLDQFVKSANSKSMPESRIIVLEGEEGVSLLQRLREDHSFFGDMEHRIVQAGSIELRNGHFVMIADVSSHEEAVQLTDLATTAGGHQMTHFGTWTTEQLSS